jgi:hypothetical protein
MRRLRSEFLDQIERRGERIFAATGERIAQRLERTTGLLNSRGDDGMDLPSGPASAASPKMEEVASTAFALRFQGRKRVHRGTNSWRRSWRSLSWKIWTRLSDHSNLQVNATDELYTERHLDNSW